MIIGIIVAVLFIMVAGGKFITKGIHNKNVNQAVGMIHKVLGVILLVLAMVHMITVWSLIKQRPFIMYVLGFVMIGCALTAFISYLLRRKLKKNWMIVHRFAAGVMLICIIAHVFFGIQSLNQYQVAVSEIEIQNVDVSNVPDGSYIGEYDVGYIYAKVKVTVTAQRITSVAILEHRTEKGKAAEAITDEIVKQQQVKVDAISGATNSSKVIMKAVQNALDSSN